MKPTLVSIAFAAIATISTASLASASTGQRPVPTSTNLETTNMGPVLQEARGGADDAPGDDRGGNRGRHGGGRDDGPNHTFLLKDGATNIQLARHGADDAPGDDRGGRGGRGHGRDDGPNHG